MHIETLKIFCDLVDMQSFSMAAERNFVSQSAVSQQVRVLEDLYERKLLQRVRGRRDVAMTGAGEVFYREAKKVLFAYDQLQESLRGVIGTIGGTVKVATIYSVGLHELPDMVSTFMTRYPAAKIDLEYSRTTRVVRDVISNVVELGVIAFPEPKRGLKIVHMPSNTLVLVCHPKHKFAKRDVVRTRELHGMDFVLFERDTPTRKFTDRILKEKETVVKKVAEFDNIETIKRAVEVGFGMAILPEPAVEEERRAGQLVTIPLAEPIWVRTIGVIYRTDRHLSLAAKKFISILAGEEEDTK